MRNLTEEQKQLEIIREINGPSQEWRTSTGRVSRYNSRSVKHIRHNVEFAKFKLILHIFKNKDRDFKNDWGAYFDYQNKNQ